MLEWLTTDSSAQFCWRWRCQCCRCRTRRTRVRPVHLSKRAICAQIWYLYMLAVHRVLDLRTLSQHLQHATHLEQLSTVNTWLNCTICSVVAVARRRYTVAVCETILFSPCFIFSRNTFSHTVNFLHSRGFSPSRSFAAVTISLG